MHEDGKKGKEHGNWVQGAFMGQAWKWCSHFCTSPLVRLHKGGEKCGLAGLDQERNL